LLLQAKEKNKTLVINIFVGFILFLIVLIFILTNI